MKDCLFTVIPCYNEEKVLPDTFPRILDKINNLVSNGIISKDSTILFVDDGSVDGTWNLIQKFSQQTVLCRGIRLSRNRGHQNAILAGLTEAANKADFTITMDCDGQDDIDAIDLMIDAYYSGSDVVYGVRNNRNSDSFFKRFTAECYYKLLKKLGSETIYNHADFRLLSSKVLNELLNYSETNLYFRGIVPLIGFPSSCIEYTRKLRISGNTHYSLTKMIDLASNGITGTTVTPLRFAGIFGGFVCIVFFLMTVFSIVALMLGNNLAYYMLLTSIVCFLNGCILLSLGIAGEYLGKMFLEVKKRPRFIISERTYKSE